MAFDANINLNLDNSKALKGVNDVEKAVNRLATATDKVRLKVEGVSEAEKQAARLYKALERIENAALSNLPRSVQLLIAYLKAANSGMAQLSARAALAAAGIGEIGRVNLAPLVRQLNDVKDLMFEIQRVQIKFMDAPMNFRPRLEGGEPFQKLLDGLDLVRVRIVNVREELENLLRLAGRDAKLLGAGGVLGVNGPRGISGGGAGGGGGGGGGGGTLGGSNNRALPPADFSFLNNPQTLRGLRTLRADLQDLLDTTVIGSRQFRRLEDAIADVNNRIKDAQLLGQSGGSGIDPAADERARRRAEDARRERLRRLQNIGTGVGFSALFGGGLGEIIGGGVGAAAGGLGASLIGSVIGRAFDNLQQQAVELGAALNSTTFDAKKLAEAFGTQGSSIQRLLEETKEVAGASAAAEQAANLLAVSIGDKAVQSFKDLDAANRELNDALSQLNTEFAAVAATIAGPLISAIAKLLERANQANARQRILDEGGEDAQRVRDAFNRVKNEGGSADAANRAAQLEAVKILEERRATKIQQTKDFNVENSKALEILRNEEQILIRGSDLLNDQVFALEKQNIELRTAAKLSKDNLTDLERKAIEQERLNDLKTLENRRADEAARAAEKAARETERVAKGSKAEERKQFELATKLNMLGETKQRQLEIERQRLEGLFNIRAEEIILGEKDATLRAEKLKSLDFEKALLMSQNGLAMQRLQIEKELLDLKNQQSLDTLQAGLDQELAAAQRFPSGSQFADEQSDLLFEQQNRYADQIRQINQLIEQQRVLQGDKDKEVREQATRQLDFLMRQKAAYETMLPQIFAAEQAQLKFNQTLSLVQGPVDAFVNGMISGLQGIIDGTKSVEEAFADMLKGVAAALLQTAATMIAQYIAIGIARQFAGIPGGTSDMSTGGLGRITNPTDLFNGSIPFFGSGVPSFFAEGGYVTRPTSGVVGEGGESEYIIPASKMHEAMLRYRGGQRGEDVIPGSGSAPYRGGRGSDGTVVNFNGPTLRFNSEDYVPVSAIPGIIEEATKKGAKAGESRVFSKLMNSRSQRSRIGI